MNRSITNIIRYFLDEWLPPIIRDNKYFMYPLYVYAYRGRNIKTAMNFKKLVYHFSDKEYRDFYSSLNTISRNRKTDINEPTIKHVLNSLDSSTSTLLDVGCGNGYFLERVASHGPSINLFGCDIIEKKNHNVNYTHVIADIKRLPFKDKEFDTVTCFHTLEHILRPEKAIEELKRVAQKRVIIGAPCQRYYFYTLDEHVNFYFYQEKLIYEIGLEKYECKKIAGDYLYIGYLD
jgi:ubiquinone/menaquinone biosynthesis C-methylase UbiE